MKRTSFKNRSGEICGNILMGLVYLFLYAPLIVMIVFSFNAGKSTSVFQGFDLRWYRALFAGGALLTYLKNSLLLAVLSSVLATVLGTLAAVGIYQLKSKRISSAILTVNNIPMMNPDIVTGVSMMMMFVFVGGFLAANRDSVNFFTLLIAHVTFNTPYVLLNVLPKLKATDKRLVEAPMDLGCTPVQAFFKVVLPQLVPGILSGLLMAFTLSFDDFVISYYTSGADFVTLPVYIYSLVKKTVKPDVYALYTIIFVAILLLLIVYNALQNKGTGKKSEKKKKSSVIRTVAFATAAVVLVVGLFVFSPKPNVELNNLIDESYYVNEELEGTALNVYNWAVYISDGEDDTLDVIAAFEELTGIKVNYVTYESNEVMYSKLEGESVSYDIVIPSDYMIAQLISKDMLQKLDFERIPNYGLIDEKYKNMYFDPENEYSVPFSVGLVGLIYNTTMVEETPDSWSVMWDEQYKGQILTFNNSRDAFMIAQMMAGVDVNSTSKADWDKAAELLRSQKKVLQGYAMDEVFNKMEGGNAAIAPYYAGDFLTMQGENPDLEMIYPKEGTNIFVDSICVPKGAKNYDAAMMFINFLLEPEVALANAEYICYATPNTAVLENEDYSLKDNKYLYPENYDEVVSNASYYQDLPAEIKTYYGDLWTQIKGGG